MVYRLEAFRQKFTRTLGGICSSVGAVIALPIMLIFNTLTFPAHSEISKKRILFIASYSPSFPSFFDQINGLKTGLRENGFGKGSYFLDIEYLDSKRFPLAARAKQLEADLATKFKKLPPYDLIVAADDNALNFTRERQSTLLRGSKVVFLGVNNVSLALKQNALPDIVGVVERRSAGETLDLIKRLFPKNNAIHVIGDETPTGKINHRFFKAAARTRSNLNIVEHSLARLTYGQLFERFKKIPENTAVFLNSVHRDKTGANQNWEEFIARLKAVYKGPIFSLQKAPIGHGALGGKVVTHVEQGRAAALLVSQILSGIPSGNLRVIDESPNLYLFDFHELERFNLNKSALPRGSRIINTPTTILNEYAHWVVVGVLVFALQLVLILVLTNTIRQRRLAEVSLRESDARFRAFFDNSPSIMYMKTPDHKMTMVNARYLEFYGSGKTTVLGNRGGSSLTEEQRKKAEELDRAVFETEKAASDELSITSHAGVTGDFIVTKFPILADNETIIGIGGINTDVTVLRKRETQLTEARNQAEEAARQSAIAAELAEEANRTKSRFLATMSHEIRTPMNGVLGMAEVLAQTTLNDDQQDYVQTIRESGKALLDLLNDILDLSKIEAGRIELEMLNLSLSDLLSAAEGLWKHPASEKGLRFSIQNDAPNVQSIKSDLGRLRQVVNNLVGNAIKFTHEGQIELRVIEENRDNDLIGLRFEVRDSGIGIDEKQIEKLFSPFSQADSSTTRQYGGTGLGLTISKNLVEMFGGEIGVESTPGEGSVFWFTIAAERGDVKPHSSEESIVSLDVDPEIVARRHLRILVAEDNLINQKVISSMLAPIDCQFDIVQNGLEAVAAITRSNYDLILMDIQMPQMDGMEATNRIRALPNKVSETPIIAMTANAMQGDRETYLGVGMNEYVSKPIDQRELISAIVRQSDIAMPDMSSLSRPGSSGPEVDATPLTAETEDQLSGLMGEIDGLLDGTND
ncbi:MAG: response regulator [Alphaproteobacteria bacterium]|nr:response regulator [Alphaproteobacteria bacterium]